MKKIILLLVSFCFLASNSIAQDIIHLKNNTTIEAVVQEANINFVKYTKFSDPEGEEFTVNADQVVKIVFSNGYVREYAESSSPKKTSSVSDNPKDSYFALAAGFGRSYGGIGLRAQGRFGRRQGFGVHAGVGYNPANYGGACFGLGAKFFYYKGLYINAQIGIVTHDQSYDYWDGYYESEPVFGFSFLTGGDFIFGKHAGLNAAIGPTITGDGIKLGFDLGFVFKF
ncbi:MAG: hypothetical protein R6V23_12770 [Bacteroidales bacterium]